MHPVDNNAIKTSASEWFKNSLGFLIEKSTVKI